MSSLQLKPNISNIYHDFPRFDKLSTLKERALRLISCGFFTLGGNFVYVKRAKMVLWPQQRDGQDCDDGGDGDDVG